MRHRRLGRVLGRSASHRKALFKNMVAALFLTERDATDDANAPKVKGRIVTTLPKAKELRPFVERSITLAKKLVLIVEKAAPLTTDAKRNSEAWKQWRNGEGWQKWNAAVAPAVAARRRLVQMIGDKQAVGILVNDIAPRFMDRTGGYTRVLKLSKPRLGDGGARAILELVGIRDRKVTKSEKPAFGEETAAS